MTEATERLSSALADRYQILRRLGEGGMATVYLAEDLKHKRQVAVKVLKPELAAVLGAERFVQEIQTTASLQHPHILALFDSGEADSFLYYVMPYVEGETLRQKLDRETQLGIDESIRIATEVADALDYAHRHGVIHRDIKPENILLHDGRPVVADFGIALAVSAAAGGRMTETGLSLGTPHYMSPEQATAEKDISARSDVYSLGSVLYEMLAGEPPHLGNSAQQIIMKIIADDARPVTELRKSVPANVGAAVAKSLAKLPADRFESAQAFGQALADTGFTDTTAEISKAPFAASHRVSLPMLAIAGVAALALVLALWGWLRPTATEAPVMRYRMTFDQGDGLVRSWGVSLALSPDGSRMVYVGLSGTGQGLFVRGRDELQSTRLVGSERGWQPFMAPDGRRVGVVSGSRGLTLLSLEGEPPVVLADSGLWRGGGAWGRDGSIYVGLQAFGTGLARLPVAGGPAEPVTVTDSARGEAIHLWPDVLPNGKGLLYTVSFAANNTSERDEIAVVDLATGTVSALVQGILGRYFDGFLIFVTADGSVWAAPFDQDALELTGSPEALGFSVEVVPGPDLAVSSSGRLVYRSRDAGDASGELEVVWVDRTGAITEVTPGWTIGANMAQGDVGPSLSPDGRRIAIELWDGQSVDVWIKDLPSGTFSRLTFDGGSHRPRWSHDGRTVTYRNQLNLAYDLHARRADGTGTVDTLVALEAEIFVAEWSRDGQWLVGTLDAGDIFAMQRGADVPDVILDEGFRETSPVLSPDGAWLAYVSDESGRNEIYLRSFPDVRETKRQLSLDGGIEPRWSHPGTELFYKNAQGQMVALTLDMSAVPTVTERRVLFTLDPSLGSNVMTQSYAVAPDDSRFLMYRDASGDRGREALTVVENFGGVLREQFGQ